RRRTGESDASGRRRARARVRQRAKPDLAERIQRPIGGVLQREHGVDTAKAVDLCLTVGLDGDVDSGGARAGDLPDQQRPLTLRRGVCLARVEFDVDPGWSPGLRREIFERQTTATHAVGSGGAASSGPGSSVPATSVAFSITSPLAVTRRTAGAVEIGSAGMTSLSRSLRIQNCVSGTSSPNGDKNRPFGARTTSGRSRSACRGPGLTNIITSKLGIEAGASTASANSFFNDYRCGEIDRIVGLNCFGDVGQRIAAWNEPG